MTTSHEGTWLSAEEVMMLVRLGGLMGESRLLLRAIVGISQLEIVERGSWHCYSLLLLLLELVELLDLVHLLPSLLVAWVRDNHLVQYAQVVAIWRGCETAPETTVL